MKNWMKVLPLSALLFSGVASTTMLSSAFAQEKDTQTELEKKGMFYWAQKPAQCSSSEAVVEQLKKHGELPTVWMEGLTGMPNGSFNGSKFVIAINPKADPVTWTLLEFVDDGEQACILGFGRGMINISMPEKDGVKT